MKWEWGRVRLHLLQFEETVLISEEVTLKLALKSQLNGSACHHFTSLEWFPAAAANGEEILLPLSQLFPSHSFGGT